MDYGLAASRAWSLAGVSAALAAPLGLSPRSVVLAGASTAIALKYNHMQRGILQLVG